VKVLSEHLRGTLFAFSLFWYFWELLEESVWLFRTAESLSYDFQTILHFADIADISSVPTNSIPQNE
jgi:hypothetical protein